MNQFFSIKYLASEFSESQINCLIEKIKKKYISFSVALIKNDIRINEKGKEETGNVIRFDLEFLKVLDIYLHHYQILLITFQ